MYIAWPTEYDGDRSATSIVLSTGERYTPEKGKPPVAPGRDSEEINLRKWGECNSGFGVCAGYIDYEHMKAAFRLAVFD